ncbi:MAG: RHS repeat-associated core domain-containing protein [Pseudomonadota bacterium]
MNADPIVSSEMSSPLSSMHAAPPRHSLTMRAITSAVLFTLIYTPILGSFSGTVAAAQTVQNTTTSYQYDANGNLTQITDPLGRITNQTYDSLNRLKQQTQPAPAVGAARPVIGYAYDGQDQIKTVTDPRNLPTTYTVDGLGNQTALVSPDTGTTANTFDAAGNLKTSKDARGKTTTYTYDALNRVTRIAYATGTATAFEYDGGTTGAAYAKGRLTKITDESGNTIYSYDAKGRTLDKAQTVGTGTALQTFAVNYTYGNSGFSNGKLIALTYPSGNQVNVDYDATGQIANLSLNPTSGAPPTAPNPNFAVTVPLLTGIGYATFGAPTGWTWGNSTVAVPNLMTRTFDTDGRLTSFGLGNSSKNGVVRSVMYDAASRINSTSHAGQANASTFNQTYGYDNLDRLTGFVSNSGPVGPNTSQNFTYDATGNRTQTTLGTAPYSDVIDAVSNRLASTTGPAPAKTNVYDADGNLTSDGSKSFIYSDRGRMKSATIGTSVVSYQYNGLGQRVQKSGPSSLVATGRNRYIYDETGHLLGEYDTNGKALQETVYLGDLPVATLKQTVTGTAPNQITTTQVYYIYADQIDTPRVITRSTDNQIVWRWDNADPFGSTAANDNPSNLGTFTYNPRFPGQLFDKETGLHYNYFRDYDPTTGRYVQSDPIGLAGGGNTFSYVEGNSLNYSDEFGLARDLKKFPINLPGGHGARIDQVPQTDIFEIHVCGPNGTEIGLFGADGWFNKHGHKGAPKGIPTEVENALKGMSINELRRREKLPKKGRANIKGDNWLKRAAKVCKGCGPIGSGMIIIGGLAAGDDLGATVTDAVCEAAWGCSDLH